MWKCLFYINVFIIYLSLNDVNILCTFWHFLSKIQLLGFNENKVFLFNV